MRATFDSAFRQRDLAPLAASDADFRAAELALGPLHAADADTQRGAAIRDAGTDRLAVRGAVVARGGTVIVIHDDAFGVARDGAVDEGAAVHLAEAEADAFTPHVVRVVSWPSPVGGHSRSVQRPPRPVVGRQVKGFESRQRDSGARQQPAVDRGAVDPAQQEHGRVRNRKGLPRIDEGHVFDRCAPAGRDGGRTEYGRIRPLVRIPERQAFDRRPVTQREKGAVTACGDRGLQDRARLPARLCRAAPVAAERHTLANHERSIEAVPPGGHEDRAATVRPHLVDGGLERRSAVVRRRIAGQRRREARVGDDKCRDDYVV